MTSINNPTSSTQRQVSRIEHPVSSIQNPASRIDSHQHFWKYDPIRDGWISDEMKVLKKDFLPEQLSPILTENKIDGCVAVQADQSETETEFLVELANQNSFIKGVVGWVDFCSDKIIERLDFFSHFKKIKGFRHIVQAEPKGFLMQPKFLSGISQLKKYNFTYDILIHHHQLMEVNEFVEQFPNQKFVVDHLAKPDIKNGEFKNWSKGLASLASRENISCKLSGLTTEAYWNSWTPQDLKPYLDFALECFGAKRLLYGSDWPVCLLSSSYKSQLSLIEEFIATLTTSEKQQVMGGNATDFYNL